MGRGGLFKELGNSLSYRTFPQGKKLRGAAESKQHPADGRAAGAIRGTREDAGSAPHPADQLDHEPLEKLAMQCSNSHSRSLAGLTFFTFDLFQSSCSHTIGIIFAHFTDEEPHKV